MTYTLKMLNGNSAVTEAMKFARISVISAYPITPQSPIAERLSVQVEKGVIKAKYIRVESEHSALSCAIGAQLTGIRAATATSSVGLALMHEVLGVASGCRVPLVMPVVNRALVSPWSLWCDHQDSMSARDSGWLQCYAETVQEVFDCMIMAYRIAEHEKILLPIMVCLDGFYVSHSTQPVTIYNGINQFIHEYQSNINVFLDPKKPMIINNLTPPEEFSEMRYQQDIAFQNALNIIPDILNEFNENFDTNYSICEKYKTTDAEVVLITLGSMAGTAKHVVNTLRKNGYRVGVIKLLFFRPFPSKELKKTLKNTQQIAVLDRSAGLGSSCGPVALEVKNSLKNFQNVYHYIVGLGGRDITEKTIEKIFLQLLNNIEIDDYHKNWIDTKKDPFSVRIIEKITDEKS